MCERAHNGRESIAVVVANLSTYRTRNRSLVLVEGFESFPDGEISGTVVFSTDKSHPLGSRITYMTNMGHVLCRGDGDGAGECVLHPMDAIELVTYPHGGMRRDAAAVALRARSFLPKGNGNANAPNLGQLGGKESTGIPIPEEWYQKAVAREESATAVARDESAGLALIFGKSL